MSKTELWIDFHFRGPRINPDLITEKSGVQPTRSFKVGEKGKPQHDIHKLAGWEWRCKQSSDEIEDLWKELITTLLPIVDCINEAKANDSDAEAWVDIYGTVYQDLLTSVEDLKAYQFVIGGTEQDPYDKDELKVIDLLPMVHGDRVGIYMESKVIKFLASISATFDSDISIEITENKSWEELRHKLREERAHNNSSK